MSKLPFDFGSGTVLHSSWDVDESRSLEEQSTLWGEDLITVEYRASGLNLDIGWHRRAKVGEFRALLVRKNDWEHPLIERRSRSLEALHAEVREIVRQADEMEQQSRKDPNANPQPFDFGEGIVTRNFWNISELVPLEEQTRACQYNLIQVEYKRSGLVLDISWNQSDPGSRGEFLIMLAAERDWHNAITRERAGSLKILRATLARIVSRATEMERRALRTR